MSPFKVYRKNCPGCAKSSTATPKFTLPPTEGILGQLVRVSPPKVTVSTDIVVIVSWPACTAFAVKLLATSRLPPICKFPASTSAIRKTVNNDKTIFHLFMGAFSVTVVYESGVWVRFNHPPVRIMASTVKKISYRGCTQKVGKQLVITITVTTLIVSSLSGKYGNFSKLPVYYLSVRLLTQLITQLLATLLL